VELNQELVVKVSITSSIIGQSWSDSGISKGQIYSVAWRCVSTKDLDIKDPADIEEVRDATCGHLLTAPPGKTWGTTTLNGTLRLRKYDIVPVAGGKSRVFDVKASYDTEYYWAKATGLSKLLLPVEVEMEAGERTMQVWRNPSFTTQPAANLNTTADIGGTKVDEAGKPIEARVPTMSLRISLVHDVSNTSTGTLVSIYDKISTVRGTWNTSTFLHWSANEVFCTSANVSHIRDEYYRATYVFVWDRFYDCTQLPQMDNEGHVYGDGSSHAKNVYWKSLNRSTSNHNIIFNTLPDATAAAQIALEGSYLTYP